MKLNKIVEKTGGSLSGDGDIEIMNAAPIESAGVGEISFLHMRRYLRHAKNGSASAIVTSEDIAKSLPGRNLIVCPNPLEAFSKVLEIFAPHDPVKTGVSPRASVAASASIGAGASVMDFVFIDEEAEIGPETIIYPNVFVGRKAKVGANCIIYPNVTIRDRCIVGNRCVLHPGAVIGADGFGFTPGPDGFKKIPQIGRAVLEDDVEIGANTTIDRGAVGDTVISRGVKLDNLIMVGHNVKIGEHTVAASQAGISGSTKIGSWVMIGGQAGFVGHIEIGNGAKIGAQAGIMGNVEDGATVAGYPAIEKTKWLRQVANLEKMDRLMDELRKREREKS